MSEYLIAGALLALVALLWFVRARQRRSAQQDQGAESTLAAPSRFRAWRASSRLDSIQPALAPDSDPEAVALRAQREAAEEAARIEGDREAAEWEARLAAEQLAERAEEQDRVAAESQLEALTQQASAATAQAAAERSEREALESLERAYADSQHERQADDGAAQAPTTPPASLPRPELTLEPAPAPAPAPKPGVVMVADASKVVRIKTSRLLEQHGWQTTLATDGLLALEHIRRADLHALITGTELSGLDGLALTRELRADPRTARLPIVMISADDASLREAARQAGVSLLLGKPYPADELIDFLASTRETAAEA